MYRVVKKDGRFYVKKDGATRASKSFDNEKEANEYCEKKNKELGISPVKEINTPKEIKQIKKAYKKVRKNKPLVITLLVLILLIGIAFGVCYALYPDKINGLFKPVSTPTPNPTPSGADVASGVIYDDFQIHFMMLGNDKAGDSIYIKAGDVDILIDAGSRSSSFETTKSYIDKYCTDKKLEYVIATHGDQDHIDAFPKLLDYYKADNIIYNKYTTKTTATYQRMLTAFEKQKAAGANVYYAEEFFNMGTISLSSTVSMSLLYNKFYFGTEYINDKGKTKENDDENNFSVCTMFTYTSESTSKYFMFTGDLEAEGERQMALYYDGSTKDKTLPEVDLFKAGHHGSKTSSNDCLLEIIKPKMCVVSCCCGTNEYTGITENQFPTQDFIDRIAKWTDAVYVTSIYDTYEIATKVEGENVPGVAVGGNYVKTSGSKAMNGNICVSCGLKTNDDGTKTVDIGLSCSNNDLKLKDSEWMHITITIDGKERPIRKMPSTWL